MNLKVDLALPVWQSDPPVPIAATAKPGWTIWAAGDSGMSTGDRGWDDMYMHDFKSLEDIDGTGISIGLTSVGEGKSGLVCKGMCRGSYGHGYAPTGNPEGDPIANTWYNSIEYGGFPKYNVTLGFYCLPAGEYTLTSYHNFWLPCSNAEKKCTDCDPNMPPMPSVWAMGLVDAEHLYDGYAEVIGPYADSSNKMRNAAGDCLGNPGGVELIDSAYNIEVTSTLNDDEVATSEISFRTNGSAVLVIYEAPADWTDPRGRDGGRGILNAFELVIAGGPPVCPCPGDLNADTQIDLDDLQAVAGILLQAGSPFIVSVDEGHCGDLNNDEQIDLDDLQAVAGILLNAGSPFIVPCQ
jgi:hypothetical protein